MSFDTWWKTVGRVQISGYGYTDSDLSRVYASCNTAWNAAIDAAFKCVTKDGNPDVCKDRIDGLRR